MKLTDDQIRGLLDMLTEAVSEKTEAAVEANHSHVTETTEAQARRNARVQITNARHGGIREAVLLVLTGNREEVPF